MKQVAAVILGAGKGSRMNSDLPKVMMPVCGISMVKRIVNTLEDMGVDQIVTVVAPDGDMVKQEVTPHKTCVQDQQLGTGHAVMSAKTILNGFEGTVIVVFGDTPLISKATFENAISKVEAGNAVVVTGFRPQDPARYGRLVVKGDKLEKIVEFKDASDEERKINFCNSGFMSFNGKYLFNLLDAIGNENAVGEYYLTDVVEIAQKMGLSCSTIEALPEEVASANTKEELALLEEYLQKRK